MSAWKILVVDDDPDIRRIAELALGHIGRFRVVLAAGGQEGLAAAEREAPDAVLLDVSMPGLDGPATLAALRKLPVMDNVPVIFFTATANDAEVARLCALGAVAVVPKPFDIAGLANRIRSIMQTNSKDRDKMSGA